MKALKEAIELLKFFKDRKNTKITTMIKVQSCISELEALQQPKSCESCREHIYRTDNYGHCATLQMATAFDWFCADFKPKEQP